MRAFTRTLLRPPTRHVRWAAASTHGSHRPNQLASTSPPNDRIVVAESHVISHANEVSSTPSFASPHWNHRSSERHPSSAFEDDTFIEEEQLHQPQPTAAAAATARHRLTAPVVLEDVEDSQPLSPTQDVHGRQLWAGTKVLRSHKHARQRHAACVVGGASAIRRIWRVYKVRPSVVYVPNTTSTVPAWCLEEELPTVIVRCSPVAVKRQLLSAEYSDGYAAEFPLPPDCVMDAVTLLDAPSPLATEEEEREEKEASSPPVSARPNQKVESMLVLVGLRIPSNVGALLRAAVEMGYDAALLVNCVDATQEKVLRASDGTGLCPGLRIYETGTTAQSCVSLLSEIAARHQLMPFLAVPSQEVDPAFEVAKRFHVYNSHNAAAAGQNTGLVSDGATGKGSLQTPPPPRLGAMVVLGSEAQGLRDLHGTWSVPYQLVTLPLPNPMVDSYNVSVAGSVLLHLFRPGAAAHFDQLVELSGETVADLLPRSEEKEEELEGSEEERREEEGHE